RRIRNTTYIQWQIGLTSESQISMSVSFDVVFACGVASACPSSFMEERAEVEILATRFTLGYDHECAGGQSFGMRSARSRAPTRCAEPGASPFSSFAYRRARHTPPIFQPTGPSGQLAVRKFLVTAQVTRAQLIRFYSSDLLKRGSPTRHRSIERA